MKTLVDVRSRTNTSQVVDPYDGEYTETNVSQYMSGSAYDDLVTAGSASKVAVEAAKAACECAAEAAASASEAATSASVAQGAASDAKEAAEWAFELSKDFGQVEADLAEMKELKAETVINAAHAAESANNAAESAIAAGLSEDNAKASEIKAKEYLDQFLEGSIYGGVWNVGTNTYPTAPTLNTTWDVALPAGQQEHEFDNKTWNPGDKLIYTTSDTTYHQIKNPQGGVFSVNGQKGVVVLDSKTMTSVFLTGDGYDDLFDARYGLLATGIYIRRINGSNLKNHDPLIAVVGGTDYEATISITNDSDSYTMRVSFTTDGEWDHQGRESVMSGVSFDKAKANGWESVKFLEDPEHIRVNSNTVTDISFGYGFSVDYDAQTEMATISPALTPELSGALSAFAGTISSLDDWNNATLPGSWKVSNVNLSAPNKPPTTDVKDGICFVQAVDDVITQTYMSADVNNPTAFFIRSSVNGLIWTGWAAAGSGGGGGIPVGTIVMFAHVGEIPEGFINLSVDDPTFDVLLYPNLAKLYPDGILPSYKDRYPRGSGTFEPGRKTGWVIPEHSHTISLPISGTTGEYTHSHSGSVGSTNAIGATTSTDSHNHNRGNMEITGNFGKQATDYPSGNNAASGAFTYTRSTRNTVGSGYTATGGTVNFNASRSWSGVTSTDSHNHTVTIPAHSHSLSIGNNTHSHPFTANVFGESRGISDLLTVGNDVEVDAVNTVFAIKASGDINDASTVELDAIKKAIQANADKIEDLEAGGGSAVSSVNGKTGDVVLAAADIGALGESDRASLIRSWDTRDVNESPIDVLPLPGLRCDFKRNETNGFTAGAGSYNGVISFRPYGSGGDISGGSTKQIVIGHDGKMAIRVGTNTWDNWSRIYTERDRPPVPAATSSTFGGFKYTFSNGTLNLFTR